MKSKKHNKSIHNSSTEKSIDSTISSFLDTLGAIIIVVLFIGLVGFGICVLILRGI